MPASTRLQDLYVQVYGMGHEDALEEDERTVAFSGLLTKPVFSPMEAYTPIALFNSPTGR